uniref:Uncharacterized protein n=1 Tax=Ciona savignyi TaxID=51511 RepID=H2YWZ8_CIOSA
MEDLERQQLVSGGSTSNPVSPLNKQITDRAKLLHSGGVGYEQQNMYSWMQQSQKPTTEPLKEETAGPNESMLLTGEAKEQETDMTIDTLIQNIQKLEFSVERLPKYQEMYSHFLINTGVNVSETEASSTFVQSQCLGSLEVDANLMNLRVDQQQPDRLYTRESRSRRKKREPSRRYKARPVASTPFSQSKSVILLFQGFCFN